MSTAALVNTALISSNKNVPIIKLELKKPVPTEGLHMNEQQEAKIQATTAALNLGTATLAQAKLAQGLDDILKQAYENNKKVFRNQVALAATNHPNQLSAQALKQLTKALDQTLAANTPAKTVEQTNTHHPRRPR